MSVLSALIKNTMKQGENPFISLLDDYYIQRDSASDRYDGHSFPIAPPPRPSGRHSPSSLMGCERQETFKFMDVKKRKGLSPIQEMIFEDGRIRHHKWQSVFLDMEKVLGKDTFEVLGIETEVQIPELYLSGSIDAIIKMGGISYVVDIKGSNDYIFTQKVLKGDISEVYLYQITAYMKAAGIFNSMLFYENKNDQRTTTSLVPYEEYRWQEIKEWCEFINNSMENKDLPAMHHDCNTSNWMGKNCPFSYLCYGKGNMDVIEHFIFKRFAGVEEAWKKGNQNGIIHQA